MPRRAVSFTSRSKRSYQEESLIRWISLSLVLLVSWFGPSVFAGPEEFRVVRVTVSVVDPQGQPVPGAQARVYSEDWHMRFPRNSDEVTDAQGQCMFKVPVGRYSCFAGGPLSYTDLHPGQGLYVVRGPLDIRDSCTVVLQPDSFIRVKVTGDGGLPLPFGRLQACESSHAPWILQPQVGVIRNGRIDLATNSGYRYHLVAHNLYEEGQVALLLGKANVAAGSELWLRGDLPSGLARLRVEVLDGNDRPGKATVRFDIPELSRGCLYAAHGISGSRDYVLTPMLLGLSYEMRDERGWCVSSPRYCRLQGGSSRFVRFGGRLAVTPRISDTFGYTEFLVDAMDRGGNQIALAVDPRGNRDFSVTVLKKGRPLFSGQLKAEGAPLALAGYIQDDLGANGDLEFTASLDFCPLGRHELRGHLIPNVRWQQTRAGPFLLGTPEGYTTQTAVVAKLIERITEAQAGTVGARPAAKDFPVWIKTNPIFARPGKPGGLNACFFDWFLALDPAAVESNCDFVLPHEIGHIMQGSGDKASPGWYVGLANEAQANLLGFAAKSSLYSARTAWMDAGEILNLRFVENWETRTPIPPVHGYNLPNFYVLKRFGWKPHQRNNAISWLRTGDYERLLGMIGLTKVEAMTALLSYLCDQDLCWLYRLADFRVREKHVHAGMRLLSKNLLSLGYPTGRIILCDPPGSPLSFPLHVANNTEKPLTVQLRLEPETEGWKHKPLELPGGSGADLQVQTRPKPELATDFTLSAAATPELCNTIKITYCPVQPAALTDGTTADTFPCLLPTRHGLLLAWKRRGSIAVGKFDKERLGFVQLVSEQSSYPRLLELKEGKLWLAYNADRNGAGNIFFRTSADGGATWTAEQQITFAKPYVTCGAALAEDVHGAVWVACSNGITMSRDAGKTWTQPRPIADMSNGWFNLLPVPPTGMLAMIGCASFDISITYDSGTTWPPFRTIDAYPRSSVSPPYPFPYLLRGRSGRLHLTYNSDRGGNSLWYRSSPDDGETWGDMARVAFGENVADGSSVAEVGESIWVVWAKRVNSNVQLMLSVLPRTVSDYHLPQ